MGAFAIPLLVLSTVTAIGGTVYGAEAQKSALRERQREEGLAANQQKLTADKKIERVLTSQKAQEAATPFATSSQTFGAIAQESLNEFSEDREMLSLNEEMKSSTIDKQIGTTTGQEFLGVANSLFDAGTMYYRIKNPESDTNLSSKRYGGQ